MKKPVLRARGRALALAAVPAAALLLSSHTPEAKARDWHVPFRTVGVDGTPIWLRRDEGCVQFLGPKPGVAPHPRAASLPRAPELALLAPDEEGPGFATVATIGTDISVDLAALVAKKEKSHSLEATTGINFFQRGNRKTTEFNDDFRLLGLFAQAGVEIHEALHRAEPCDRMPAKGTAEYLAMEKKGHLAEVAFLRQLKRAIRTPHFKVETLEMLQQKNK